MDCLKNNTKKQTPKNQPKSRMTWKMRMGGFLNKKDHLLGIFKMRTSKHDNPTHIHEVNHDIVCIKENFGINSKMFRSDASINGVGISKGDALNGIKISEAPKVKYKCEYDKWSPNESMR